jgi:hypothetical protein
VSKNRPDAGTLDIPIQRAIFGQKVCPFRVFDIASASTGSLRECRFLDNDLHFLDSLLCGFVLWIILEEHEVDLLEAPVRCSRGFSL